ncbi:MAG: RidA family protein [Chloroflexi bacterium]|nr:RidA family protein [Chloroflexota bacterium]
MPKHTIRTHLAPLPIGPYSQGIVAGNTLYTAGQIPLDPATGQLVEGDIRVQTARVLANLEAILDAAGFRMADVVKATIFLADMGDFAAMNAVYGATFAEPFPVRSTVQAARLPAGALLEIDLVAVRD